MRLDIIERIVTSDKVDVKQIPQKLRAESAIIRRLQPKCKSESSRNYIHIDMESQGYKALWRSVLIQAIYDLSGKTGNIERKVLRAQTITWMGTQDFYDVCELAELDPKLMIRLSKEIRSAGIELYENMDFKSLRKAILKNNNKERA